MNDKSTPKQEQESKKPIQILRARRGGLPHGLMDQNRRQKKLQKQLVEGLKNGPQTVPELAQIAGIPTHEVLWHVMCMKKYGKIVEGEECDGYFKYELSEESQK